MDDQRKVPEKYLKGLKDKGKKGSKEAMKREIEKFSGKDKYKQNWDADYDDEGDRINTKQGAATKAFKKRFGEIIQQKVVEYMDAILLIASYGSRLKRLRRKKRSNKSFLFLQVWLRKFNYHRVKLQSLMMKILNI